MKTLFAPGCALRNYKPHLVSRMSQFLIERGIVEDVYLPCCKSGEKIEDETEMITCCPGCSHHFESDYANVRPISLWKTLLDTDFPFPDYHKARMTIHDACHARQRNSSEMQESARLLCDKMNIVIVEPKETRDETRCCGGSAQDYETRRQMALRRAGDFPEENVVVYCTGCVRSFSLTPAVPRHLLDLLYDERTEGLTVKR
ncbi:MAG: (Fe-S)-binding protein [Clostridia bacterium]|nr:(Fe-S)-binding protein [Clostridia bacterium]